MSAALTGDVHGTMTTEKSPPGNFRPICTTVSTKPPQWVAHVFGKIGTQDWLIAVQVSGYQGPGTYKAGVTLGALSSTGTGGNTYFGTLDTTVGSGEDSAKVSGTLTPQHFSGHNVTMAGTLSCTALTPQR